MRTISLGLRFPFMAMISIILSWPAVFNTGSFFFPDTSAYLRGADRVVFELTGLSTEWAHTSQATDQAATARSALSKQKPSLENAVSGSHPVLLGRSVYYGLFLLPILVTFGTISAAVVQAICAGSALYLSMSAVGGWRSRGQLIDYVALLALASFTTLPFFVSLLMPDFFAGIVIIVMSALLIGLRNLRKWERGLALLLLAMGALFHSSIVLILAAFLIPCAITMILRVKSSGLASAFCLIAVTVGLSGELLFTKAVEAKLGHPPVRPPFLTARLIADNVGYRFLIEKCNGTDFEVCNYIDRLPRDSDTFLWSTKAHEGVFSTVPNDVQRRLGAQDMLFAYEVIKYAPVEVSLLSLRAMLRQIQLRSLDYFVGKRDDAISLSRNLPFSYKNEVLNSRYGSGDIPANKIASVNFLLVIYLTIAVFVLYAISRRRLNMKYRSYRMNRYFIFFALVLYGVSANAIISGALSKPHDRYNSRVIWVIPVCAGIIFLNFRRFRTLNR